LSGRTRGELHLSVQSKASGRPHCEHMPHCTLTADPPCLLHVLLLLNSSLIPLRHTLNVSALCRDAFNISNLLI
jgi:hypothetical protein